MSVEADPGFWKWLLGSVIGGFGTLFGGWKWLDSRLDKKANKADVEAAIHEVRGHITHIFDVIRENERRAQDRHERLMERIANSNHGGTK